MKGYQNLYQKFLCIVFITGPLLFILAAIIFIVIIIQYGFELEAQERLFYEGIIMGYVLILFIPISKE